MLESYLGDERGNVELLDLGQGAGGSRQRDGVGHHNSVCKGRSGKTIREMFQKTLKTSMSSQFSISTTPFESPQCFLNLLII